jgi:hypothetical protein
VTYKNNSNAGNAGSNRLANYVSVAERVHDAQGELLRIETTAPIMLTEQMGYIRCTVYMRNDRTATGTATFRLDLGGNSAKATNPIEDCETSAVGRALAFLGYSADKRMGFTIASKEEIEEAQRRSEAIVAKQPNRNEIIARCEELLAQAVEKQITVTHEYLDMPWEDLDIDEIIQLGKYLKAQVSK